MGKNFPALTLGYWVGKGRRGDDLTVAVVRTYTVPVDRTEEIKAQLNRLFEGKDGEKGRAQVFNNGLLIVRAPEGYQRGIRRLIDQLGAIKDTNRSSIRMDYWLVAGQEDTASNAGEIKPLEKTLSTIVSVDGPRKFKLLEHLSTNSSNSQKVEVKGWMSEAQTTVVQTGDTLGINLEYGSRMGAVRTNTQIKPGDFLVLGQSAADPDVNQLKKFNLGPKPANIYYIIRAEILQ